MESGREKEREMEGGVGEGWWQGGGWSHRGYFMLPGRKCITAMMVESFARVQRRRIRFGRPAREQRGMERPSDIRFGGEAGMRGGGSEKRRAVDKW